ncbi:flagellin [Echinimonas agarilytica]|uniref:Flagellin n=1 Tax=Echinimonas agarilytica TaxID=1215918 RepID=A0AA41W4Y8_9GAMM|nr:flagellin [Echinimonas agarilytica]MCM2678946.1 flagellin [Echinimonas agarilytica]
MALTVQTNISSITAQRNLNRSTDDLNVSLTRLSSGLRINSARDDAAGLQISNRLTSQINGLGVATRNANDGISMSQTAEGALQESTNVLQRMRDLAIQSANGSNAASDRRAIQEEIAQLQKELTRIAETTTFGERNLLDGTFGTESFQVGANANETIEVSLAAFTASDMGAYQQQLSVASDATQAVTAGLGGVVTGAAASAPLANGVGAGTVTITANGVQVDTTITADASAKDIANVVNAVEGETAVSADARTKAILSGFSGDDTISFKLSGSSDDPLDSKTIIAVTGPNGELDGLANEINKVSGDTGVTAFVNSDGNVELVSEQGDDIGMSEYLSRNTTVLSVQAYEYDGTTVAGAATTLAGAGGNVTIAGTVRFDSATSYVVDTNGGNSLVGSSDPLGLYGAAAATNVSGLAEVSDIDVSSAKGAQDAIAVIDGALTYIDSSRAQLGAVQNRLASTISNLDNIIENQSAARSRIRDTDFAAETTELTKNQILQQAGTSILAQAQQIPQAALSLLQG